MLRRPSKRPDERGIRDVALGLLARREHSREELRRKLQVRGFDADEVASLLDDLKAEGLQSDARFTEGYVHARRGRGFGPMRVRMELQERGISEALIDEYLDARAECWRELLHAQYRKRYGDGPPNGYAERARRGRFLQQRGFSAEMIGRLLNELNKNV